MSARERILTAADALFGDVGFEGATTRQIGERAGENKALIHYHFKDKQGLFNAVLDGYYERLEQALAPSLRGVGTLRERLFALMDTYLDFLDQNRAFCRMVQREVSGAQHLDRILHHMIPLFQAGTALVEQAYPATRSGPLAARQLLVSFYGMAVSTFTYAPVLDRLMETDAKSTDGLSERKEHLHRMVELILDALESTP